MRLIDADLFMKNFEEIAKDATDLFDAVDFALEDTPIVEERHKAQWVDGVAYSGCCCKICSNCGAIMPSDSSVDCIDEEENKYCYSCGAEMEVNND